MGLVDQQPRPELPAGVGDGADGRNVALHRVHPVDGHQRPLATLLTPGAQAAGEARHRVVPEVPEPAGGQAGPVDDAGVPGDVDEGGVLWPDERRDDTEVDGVASREHQPRLGPQPVAQLGLELVVNGEGAVHQPAAGAPRAVLLDGVDRRPLHSVVTGEAQVVVGPEHDHRAPLVDDGRPCLAAHHLEEGNEPHGVGDLVLLELGREALVEQVRHQGFPVAVVGTAEHACVPRILCPRGWQSEAGPWAVVAGPAQSTRRSTTVA